MVREQMPLIQEMQSDAWWDDVTTPMLESARKRLRLLVKLIEKETTAGYTDFEDQLGSETPVALPGFGSVQTLSASAPRRDSSYASTRITSPSTS